ncbi:TM0106 family RecB-like putative nuclease [Leucobacter sp. W1038]|uniref:TM0106 family RecB-like putative nuclease n=1 Tax=Leucobacter sp. W1038 TaxID=3438281 RepID=UPI003D981FEC
MFVQHLTGDDLRLVTSASDLTAASTCEFAFLRRVDRRLGRDIEVPDNDDAMLARAAKLGEAHEARVLASYVAEFGSGSAGEPGGVVELPPRGDMTAEALTGLAELSRRALLGDADIVFQATFFDPEVRPADPHTGDPAIGFVGFADFLARTPDGAYEVQDSKLARRAKVTALLQLAAYAEQLERIGVPVAPWAVLVLGDGARSEHKLADIAPVFRSRRDRQHQILLERASAVGADGRRESAEPLAWGAAGVMACGRCEVCVPEVEQVRDPLLIAGLRTAQRDRLFAAGLTTIDEVAAALPEIASGALAVSGIGQAALARIAAQAAVQMAAVSGEAPPVWVIDPAALAAIPAPNPGDLFFDFEGDPMYREPGAEGTARWGIDYLFGIVDAHEQFFTIWAHDLDAERRALEEFLSFVAERRVRFPELKIYHYASYERTHLSSIAARHGVGEQEVDQLLREHVLVDLYPIVRQALRVGSRSYSIKKLEPLYMGDELRDESGVTNAGDSVVEYAEASALRVSLSAVDQAEGERRLADIAAYNRYDCVSTLRLRDWLLRLAREHGVVPVAPGEANEEGREPKLQSSTALALAMHASVADDARDRKAAALAASAIDYHARENKAFWWAHFARLVDPIEDWADTRDVLVVDESRSEVIDDWHVPPRGRAQRRNLRLRGELAPGSTLKVGASVYALYEYPPPFVERGAAPGARGARRAEILEVDDDGVTVTETFPLGDLPFIDLPSALAPGSPPPGLTQPGAIEEWGASLAKSLDEGYFLANPVVDIIRREPPRLVGGRPLVDPGSAEALAAAGGFDEARTIGAVVATLRQLDRSALAVQGPPGTGKTYLAARVIRTLVEQNGWRVGVVGQSHKVVENVLAGVVAAGLDPALVGKSLQRGASKSEPRLFTVLPSTGHLNFVGLHRDAGRGCVIGGTAWTFSNAARVERGSLDLLVIDEAGQFSLAPTIAASVSAERLLLLGDPQQLPQVSQGSHPEPVDTSALGWLLGAHETIPDGHGYFLAETRRMRPELTEVVSELAYEGRLNAHSTAALREVRGAGSAGLHWHPVQHAGNSTRSPEEAAEVVRIATAALRGTLSEPGEPDRGLTEADIIVVAAYNAQVECLANALAVAGLGVIRVGTVDKFQGQEAVIAIVSLAASSAEDVPRGLEFLLMRNRLNVAISRAQWAAHLVSSDRLGAGLPATAEGVAALSGYLRLTERGQRS